ncbi:autotransporter domain-containing protein [Rickettsiales bacterium LUAb2]
MIKLNYVLKIIVYITVIFIVSFSSIFAALVNPNNCTQGQICNINGGTFVGSDAEIRNLYSLPGYSNSIVFSENTTMRGVGIAYTLGQSNNTISINNSGSGNVTTFDNYQLLAIGGENNFIVSNGSRFSLINGGALQFGTNSKVEIQSSSHITNIDGSVISIGTSDNNFGYNNPTASSSGTATLLIDNNVLVNDGVTGAGYINLVAANNILTIGTSSIINNQIITLIANSSNTITMQNGSQISSANGTMSHLNINGIGNSTLNTTGNVTIDNINSNVDSHNVGTGVLNINIGTDLVTSSLNIKSFIDFEDNVVNVNIQKGSALNLEQTTSSNKINGNQNNITLYESAQLRLRNGVNDNLTFENSNNKLTFKDHSEISGGDKDTPLLVFNGGSTILNIGDAVTIGNNNAGMPSIVSKDDNMQLNITGASHSNYFFDFSKSEQVTLNFIDNGAVSYFDSTNKVYLSSSGNNFINFKSANSNAVVVDLGSIKFDPNNNIVSNNNITFSGGGTINFSNNGGTITNISLAGTSNSINIDNTSIRLPSNLHLTGNNNQININSKNRTVNIDLSISSNTISGEGTNNVINLNYNATNGKDNSYKPNPVLISGNLQGFNEINLGLTTLYVNSYNQGNSNLKLSTAIAIPSDDKADMINGSLIVNKGESNFNHKNIDVTLYGAYNYPNKTHSPGVDLPFTIILMQTQGTGSITGVDASKVNINSSTFEKVNTNISNNQVSLTINQCATISEALSGDGKCHINNDDPVPPKYDFSYDKNAMAIADLLTNLSDAIPKNKNIVVNSDVQYILDALNNNSNQQQMYNFITTLEPVNNELLLTLSENSIRSYDNVVMNQKGVNRSGDVSTWASVDIGKINIQNHNYINGASNQMTNFASGIETNISNDQVFGLSAGFDTGTVDGNDDKFKGNLQVLNVSVYHKVKITNDIYLKSLVGYSLSDYDLTRNIISQDDGNTDFDSVNQAKSSPKVNNINVTSNMYYNLTSRTSPINVLAYGGLGASIASMSKYVESGFASLTVQGFNSSVVDGKIGVTFQKAILINNNQQALVPSLSLEGLYSYYNMPDTKASFNGITNYDGNTFYNYSPNYSKLNFTPKVDLTYIISSRFNIIAYTQASFSATQNSYAVGANLRLSF